MLPLPMADPVHHTHHAELYGAGVPAINQLVLQGVDRVQATAMDGGGYFIGVKTNPPECAYGSAIRYDGWCMGYPARATSFCSGSSYAAFLETLNSYNRLHPLWLTGAQVEALRTQEMDGGRREDKVKFWGWWNADGPGCYYALCAYTTAGERVSPDQAMAGDFMNIDWKSGLGHSVVFLSWETRDGVKGVKFWSSQVSTNGYGDMWAPFDRIASVVIVRFARPEAIKALNPAFEMKTPKVSGYQLR